MKFSLSDKITLRLRNACCWTGLLDIHSLQMSQRGARTPPQPMTLVRFDASLHPNASEYICHTSFEMNCDTSCADNEAPESSMARECPI